MFELNGKIALITGATGAIGGAIAHTFHNLKATVILTGRNEDALNVLKSEIGTNVEIFPCDLSDKEAVASLVKSCPQIDILVNNAGLTKDTLLIRMKDEDWQKVLDVNLTAAFMLSKAVALGMMKQRFGRIISISSIVGITGNAGQANYAASKAGLIAMSKCLAQEVASRGVTVNCLAPGFVSSTMTDKLPADIKKHMLDLIPEGREGSPQDIANAAAFLASDEASYITGQTIHVNGGMGMF